MEQRRRKEEKTELHTLGHGSERQQGKRVLKLYRKALEIKTDPRHESSCPAGRLRYPAIEIQYYLVRVTGDIYSIHHRTRTQRSSSKISREYISRYHDTSCSVSVFRTRSPTIHASVIDLPGRQAPITRERFRTRRSTDLREIPSHVHRIRVRETSGPTTGSRTLLGKSTRVGGYPSEKIILGARPIQPGNIL